MAVTRTRYKKVRPLLARHLRSLPDPMVKRVLSANGLEASAVEDFWDDLGNFAASALPAVGGAIGTAIAPGVGTAIGAGVGSLAGSALHSAIGPGQQQPMPAPVQASQYSLPWAAPGLATTSQQSAAQLFQLLMRPGLLQALMQMVMGSAGSPTVPIPAAPTSPGASASGSTAVPVSAFTNLLSTLATQTSEAYNAERAMTASPEPFRYGASPWALSVDLASPESRAGALMNLLHESGDGGAEVNQTWRKRRLQKLALAIRKLDDRPAG